MTPSALAAPARRLSRSSTLPYCTSAPVAAGRRLPPPTESGLAHCPRLNQLQHQCRTDESSCPGHEDTHNDFSFTARRPTRLYGCDFQLEHPQVCRTEQNRPFTCSVPQNRFARAQRLAITQLAQLLMICGFHSSHSEAIFGLTLRNSGHESAR
jgi:hypothetical protein